MAFDISNKFLLKIIFDTFSLLVIGLFLLFLYLFAQPFQRGFFCNDLSIRYPYKDNTINTYALVALVLIPFITALLSVEIYRYKSISYSEKSYKILWRQIFDKLFPFVFGTLASLLVTLIAKVGLGRLRPFFLVVCKPNINCNEVNAFIYNQDFECTGIEDSPEGAVEEMRMSFMSGHASTMAFSMVYLTIYLQKRWPFDKNYSLYIRATIQTLALNLAFFVGYTRISDYWHHWSDVLIGLIQGSVASMLTVKYLSDLNNSNLTLFENLIKKDRDLENIPINDKKQMQTEFQIKLYKQNSI